MTQEVQTAICPVCSQPMRRDYDGVRLPPKPHVFWYCINTACQDGQNNKLYYGG